jgi:preprotein translocase subunit SecY
MLRKKNTITNKSLSDKILFVIFALIVFRLGTHIPLPWIDGGVLAEIAKTNSTGLLGVFNMFTGGALGRLSIFSLNIMPYITASIVMQLLTVISKELASIKKDGEAGRQKVAKYTRYFAIALSAFQGYAIAVGAEHLDVNGRPVVLEVGLMFRIIATISMVGGTVFVMWLTDQISLYGIGNGSSLLIFSGIVAGLPSALANLFAMGRSGSMSAIAIIFIVVLAICTVSLVIFVEKAFRKVSVHYPKRVVGRKIYGGTSTYIPLKLNVAGVLAPIFASALLLFPTTLITLVGNSLDTDSLLYSVILQLGHGKPLFMALYIFFIFIFSFFYTSTLFNPEETAENLRKAGAVVQNKRPGKSTAEYLDKVLTRLTYAGATYVSFICIVPEIITSQYSIPMYLGGTSILIVVNVILDIFQQLQSHMLTSQYGNMMDKKIVGGRK